MYVKRNNQGQIEVVSQVRVLNFSEKLPELRHVNEIPVVHEFMVHKTWLK